MRDQLLRAIGRRLRERRNQLGWSLTGVAYRMGVRDNSVSRWENGQREIGVRTLCRLASVLGCDPRDLLPEPASADVVTPMRALRNDVPEREGLDLEGSARRAVES